jgi:SAGA-associated factor 11
MSHHTSHLPYSRARSASCVASLLTLQAESLLDDLLNNLIRQHTLQNLSRYRSLEDNVGERDAKAMIYTQSPTKDIYGQDKIKLKNMESARYFPCDNCGRKIAGGRFAAHINKCLERRGRQ